MAGHATSVISFFFAAPPTTDIYTLSLHDALPILAEPLDGETPIRLVHAEPTVATYRSEEHTSELQSRGHLVCRLLLEKKKLWRTTRWQDPADDANGSIHVLARG